MQAVPIYGRWQTEFAPDVKVEHVEITTPDGTVETRPVFMHQEADLRYDEHGYEELVPRGTLYPVVRYTPRLTGIYHYRVVTEGTVTEEGQFQAEASDHPGYVEISPNDPRYFTYTNGEPYIPVGLNLCGPPRYPLPRGMEHFQTAEDWATLGCFDYGRWFRLLSEYGGNFCRIWLSNPYFQVETDTAGEVDPVIFNRIDRLIELARQYGVRLKLCFDHFRTFDPTASFTRVLRHPEDGHEPASMDEWFQEDEWRELWLKKVDAFMARYGGDPTIMAWELWNEINACRTSDFAIQREWTRYMLDEVRERAPHQLVVNSLGSFDREEAQSTYDDFKMDEMDFQQVHRYLDQGAPWEIARLDPIEFSIDAIQRARRPDRPVLLAETGAVNDRHTGPFRFYRIDDRGIIFHDTTFPAFFAGAAGTGQIWHWDRYVDEKELWQLYEPFTDLIEDIRPDEENFEPLDLSNNDVWCLALKGNKHWLVWARNREDTWWKVLRDQQRPDRVRKQTFDLTEYNIEDAKLETIRPWPERGGQATYRNGKLRLPTFRWGLLVRMEVD